MLAEHKLAMICQLPSLLTMLARPFLPLAQLEALVALLLEIAVLIPRKRFARLQKPPSLVTLVFGTTTLAEPRDAVTPLLALTLMLLVTPSWLDARQTEPSVLMQDLPALPSLPPLPAAKTVLEDPVCGLPTTATIMPSVTISFSPLMLAANNSHLNAQLMEKSALQSLVAPRLLCKPLASLALMEIVVGYQRLEQTLLNAKSSELAQMPHQQTLLLADSTEPTASLTALNVLIKVLARATRLKLLATLVELMEFASSLPIPADNENALMPLPRTQLEVSLPMVVVSDSRPRLSAPLTERLASCSLLAQLTLLRLVA